MVYRVLLGDELGALVRLLVQLAVDPPPLLVDRLDAVAKATVHKSVSIGECPGRAIRTMSWCIDAGFCEKQSQNMIESSAWVRWVEGSRFCVWIKWMEW